jgi:DNA mismatch repair protein MutS2
MRMDERTFETLELQALIQLASRHVQTAPGRRQMFNLRPWTLRSEILRQLEITNECVGYLRAQGRFGLSGIEDPEPILDQLRVEGTSLEPKQILVLERLLFVSKELKQAIKNTESSGLFPHLLQITGGIPDLRPVLAVIHGKILPNGEIDDNASPELRVVRRDLTERRNRIHRTLESILRGQAQAVQEEIITFRNGRFVIPVRTDSRNQIPGVVHGLSSSGQTTFVEPMTVINQNNDLVRLREQEGIEVSRILSSITQSLRENLDAMRTILGIVAELDVAQAKALFAEEFECVLPQIANSTTYRLNDARHVLLEHSLRNAGSRAVPISLELDEAHHVLVISGPNAGGKTVALKTLGLISLMAQMGFYVPAREALLPVFDQVFADIGDQQSIAANLSTFTAHMRNIAEIAERVKPPALILIDEVGTGTDPEEGAALAIAIVDHFRRTRATTVASTHYPRLKMWASQTEGVRNASVEFDERTLRPTYRLILGAAGASSGLEIARRMHLDEDILSKAKDLIEPSHVQAGEYLRRLKETLDEQEHLRASLDDERAAVAEKFSKLDAEFARKEASRSQEFEAALGEALGEFKAESERAVRKIKDRIEAARLKKAVDNQAAELRRSASKLRQTAAPAGEIRNAPADIAGELTDASEEISEGDRVRVESLDRDGIVETIRGGTYVVIVGSLRYRAERQDLSKLKSSQTASVRMPARRVIAEETADKPVASELKVIGMTADEAVDRVDKFLDEAFLAGIESVRIIHGHGKGILRNAIAEHLTNHPQVERFSLAPPEQGGSGATLVELRK